MPKAASVTLGSGSTNESDPKKEQTFDFSKSKLDVIDEVLAVEDANENELEKERNTISSMRNKNPAQIDSPPNNPQRTTSQSSQEVENFAITTQEHHQHN